MTLLIKAAALGLAGAVIALLLKKNAPELGLALSMAVCLMAAGLAMELFAQLREVIQLAQDQAGLSPAIVSPVLKCVGIGVITRLSADICKDAGQGAIASAVEICGASCALVTAMPLIRSLLQMIGEIA